MKNPNLEPNVRLNFECISAKRIPAGATSSGYGETFTEGIQHAIDFYNTMQKREKAIYHASAQWNETIYYTNEDDGYYFYTKDDLGLTFLIVVKEEFVDRTAILARPDAKFGEEGCYELKNAHELVLGTYTAFSQEEAIAMAAEKYDVSIDVLDAYQVDKEWKVGETNEHLKDTVGLV